MNDNWWGYVDAWIYEQEVTWMEKTVATPFWTGLTVFSIGMRKGQDRKSRRKHLLHDAMYSSEARTAFKGQVFSAPMDWTSMLQQLRRMNEEETFRCVPSSGGTCADCHY